VPVAAQSMRPKLRINVQDSLSYAGTLARLGSSWIGYVQLEEIIYSLIGIFLNELLHSLPCELVRLMETHGYIGYLPLA
jgi:hypothetical protein